MRKIWKLLKTECFFAVRMQTLRILKKHKKIFTIFEISKMNDSKQPIANTLTKKVYLFTFILFFFHHLVTAKIHYSD